MATNIARGFIDVDGSAKDTSKCFIGIGISGVSTVTDNITI